MKSDSEIWKNVPGWEERYEVSDHGRVRSKNRILYTAKYGKKTRFKERMLKPVSSKNKYPTVQLSRPGEIKRAYVHALVLAAFNGPVPAGLEVCHNDGDRKNNRLCNLRYDTRRNNSLDRHKHGTVIYRKGEECPSAKLTESDVLHIRLLRRFLSQRKIAGHYKVSHSTIGAVLRGTAWSHV